MNYTHAILKYIYILLRLSFALSIFTGIIFLIYYIFILAYPFVIALLFAFLINPFINFLVERLRIPRGLSTFLTIILIFSVIIGLITLVIAEMISGITYLTNVIPEHIQDMFNFIQNYFFMKIIPIWEKLTHLLDSLSPSQQTTIEGKIQSLGQETANTIGDLGKQIVTVLRNLLFSLPNIVTVLIFILLATFFISKDWYRMSRFFRKKASGKIQESVKAVYLDLKKALFGYIRAQLTLISITGFIVLIGLFVLRVDHAFTIAILSAVVDLLPYLGTGTVFVPWIIYNFFSENYFLTIGLSILYGVVIVQRQMMEPKILSSNIGLEPLPTLIALFVGFELFGFLGLILGPTTLVVFNALSHANVFKDVWRFILGKSTS